MTTKEIKILMLQRNLTVTELAQRWGRARGTVSMIIHRKFKSEDLDKKLAKALGVTLAELRGENETHL